MDLSTFYNMTYGMFVIGTLDGKRPTGCISNSVVQITNTPSTIAVSLNVSNFTTECIKKAGKFSISILSETTPKEIIGQFGFRSGRDNDKFVDVKYELVNDIPVLLDSCGYFVCDLIKTVECYTHIIFIGEVKEAVNTKIPNPMSYSYYHKVIKGKSPKASPTYIPDEKTESSSPVYKCTVCGYEYVNQEIPFEKLDDTYICPICKVPKSKFKLMQ